MILAYSLILVEELRLRSISIQILCIFLEFILMHLRLLPLREEAKLSVSSLICSFLCYVAITLCEPSSRFSSQALSISLNRRFLSFRAEVGGLYC